MTNLETCRQKYIVKKMLIDKICRKKMNCIYVWMEDMFDKLLILMLIYFILMLSLFYYQPFGAVCGQSGLKKNLQKHCKKIFLSINNILKFLPSK